MGAVAFTKGLDRPRRITRRLRELIGTVTFSSSYATGGDTGFDPANVPAANYVSMDVENIGGRVFAFDTTNKKILAYEDGATVAGALDEVPAATNLSTLGAIRYRALIKA